MAKIKQSRNPEYNWLGLNKCPKVTIVTVVYNSVKTIESTIKSVLSQTYENIEYICIDGDSTDGTKEIIQKYSSQISKIISEKDDGIYYAMNKGINLAHGEWINFMNSGDTFADKSVIENIFKGNLIKSGTNVIFGDSNILTKAGLFYQKCNNPFYKSKQLVKGKGFSHQSVFVRVELAKKYHFDLEFEIAADYKMLYSIYQNHGGFLYINRAIANYEVENGFSKKRQIRAWMEDAKIEGIEDAFRFKIWLLQKASLFFLKRLISKFVSLVSPGLFLEYKKYKFK